VGERVTRACPGIEVLCSVLQEVHASTKTHHVARRWLVRGAAKPGRLFATNDTHFWICEYLERRSAANVWAVVEV
jgi:hypothetical protein